MSPCANGTSKSFFSAKSFPEAPIKVMAYRWPVLPVCLKKSSIARKKFLPTWKVLAALRQNQSGEEKNRPSQCRNRKSRSWTCYNQSLRGPARIGSRAALTHASGFCDKLCCEYGRQNREGAERIATRVLAKGGVRH